MILKSYIVEQNLEILNNYTATLIYGENDGIKNDIRSKLKDNNKDAEIIIFFEDEILKNKNFLYENIINESLFNQKKIIFIQRASDKILNEISESLKKKIKNCKIYIFSENLEKSSKLRNLFEKNKSLAIFPCYQDNERTLINYISKELNGYKGLTGELINLIITNSNMNRKIIQNELIKIKDFFSEKNLNKEQLSEILNIKSNTTFNEVRDSALIGDRKKINKLLSEICLLNEESFFYLNNLNHRITKLLEIQIINENFNNYEQTIENLKPLIFWKDKPIYVEQLKKWNLNKLKKAARKIGETEILMKKNSNLRNDILIKNLLITLSNEAFTSF